MILINNYSFKHNEEKVSYTSILAKKLQPQTQNGFSRQTPHVPQNTVWKVTNNDLPK